MFRCLALVALLFFSIPAFAGNGQTRIYNHANMEVRCAFVTYDAPSTHWVTHHWWILAPGQVQDFFDIYYYYCENAEHNRYWTSASPKFCTTRNERFRSPIYESNQYQVCNEIGGQMVGFRRLPMQDYYDLYINL